MGPTVQSTKEVTKANKSSQVGNIYFHLARMIFTVAVATDRQLHADQESSSPPAHCKCNDPGIVFFFVFVSVLMQCNDTGHQSIKAFPD